MKAVLFALFVALLMVGCIYMPGGVVFIIVLSIIFPFILLLHWGRKLEEKTYEATERTKERKAREEEKKNEEDRHRYDQWLQGMPTKLSQKGFSSLSGKDRDELFLIYQLLMNGGDLSQSQNRLMEIALADSATSKFLELRGSQGNVPSPENSLSPQMPVAFSALGIVGAAGILQRGQIRQELNEINENLDEVSEDLDEMSGGEADPSGFDFF